MKARNAMLFLFAVLALYKTALYLTHCSYYDVRIINGFTNNSSLPLVVWCTSHSAGDIGGRALQEGDDYSWTVGITGLTLWTSPSSYHFICTVKWDMKRKEFTTFSASRDMARCGPLRRCFWRVKEDAFYFSNNGKDWIKDFPWK